MPSRAELKKISLTKLKEVKALYNNQLYDGARYLSGYVIETALKARICKILNCDYPDSGEIAKSFLTHKFDNLVKLAGLENQLNALKYANADFDANWSLVTQWSESNRYQAVGTYTKVQIETLINALEDRDNGVLTWIKKRW